MGYYSLASPQFKLITEQHYFTDESCSYFAICHTLKFTLPNKETPNINERNLESLLRGTSSGLLRFSVDNTFTQQHFTDSFHFRLRIAVPLSTA